MSRVGTVGNTSVVRRGEFSNASVCGAEFRRRSGSLPTDEVSPLSRVRGIFSASHSAAERKDTRTFAKEDE